MISRPTCFLHLAVSSTILKACHLQEAFWNFSCTPSLGLCPALTLQCSPQSQHLLPSLSAEFSALKKQTLCHLRAPSKGSWNIAGITKAVLGVSLGETQPLLVNHPRKCSLREAPLGGSSQGFLFQEKREGGALGSEVYSQSWDVLPLKELSLLTWASWTCPS